MPDNLSFLRVGEKGGHPSRRRCGSRTFWCEPESFRAVAAALLEDLVPTAKTPYEEALSKFPLPAQQAIRKRLHRWAKESDIGTRVPANLRAERFADWKVLWDLLSVVLNCAASPHPVLEGQYRKACTKNVKKGGGLKMSPAPNYLGRAIDRQVWVNFLLDKHAGLFSYSRKIASALVNNLVSTPGYKIQFPQDQALMSEFAAWATWNENNLSEDPFYFATTSRADAVRSCLGLVAKRRGRSAALLLLRYDTPAATPLFNPTVADAGTYPFFKPADLDSGDTHGWTLPWPREELIKVLAGFTPISRPELLHPALSVKALRLPLECLS